MTLIGLTQRVERIPEYGERRDALDQSWTTLLAEAGLLPVPLSNTVTEERVAAYVEALSLGGIILTGGNDLTDLAGARNTAPERDRFEWALLRACLEREIPVVGICRGMQVINVFMGGSLVPVVGHAGTRHRVVWNGETVEVGSYHDYGVPERSLGTGLTISARAEDGTVEAFRHETKALFGLMWHPEREDPFRNADLRFLASALGGGA